MKRILIFQFIPFILFLTVFGMVNAQEGNKHKKFTGNKTPPRTHMLRHTVALLQGITFVPFSREHASDANSEIAAVTTTGLTYANRFNHRWAFGVAVDVQHATYFIEANEKIIERDQVFVSVLQCYFEPVRGVSVFAGPGMEFESHENFLVLKAGIEFEMYLANNWWIIPEASFEFKEVYTNYNIGLKLAKSFGRSKHSNEKKF